MKNVLKTAGVLVIAAGMSILSACDKTSDNPAPPKAMKGCNDKVIMGTSGTTVSASSPYNVHISELFGENGKYTWIWEIKNDNPGNGTNGTVQDLSHWGIDLGTCIKLTDIIEAAYSQDGKTWIKFTPEFQVDKSQNCSSLSYVKFDFGTTGSQISYYKLIITKNVTHVDTKAIYKSGTNTGCGKFLTCGFGCPDEK